MVVEPATRNEPSAEEQKDAATFDDVKGGEAFVLREGTDYGPGEYSLEDKVAQVLAKPAMLGWFVGQVMKSSGGKANPQAVNDLLKSKLGL